MNLRFSILHLFLVSAPQEQPHGSVLSLKHLNHQTPHHHLRAPVFLNQSRRFIAHAMPIFSASYRTAQTWCWKMSLLHATWWSTLNPPGCRTNSSNNSIAFNSIPILQDNEGNQMFNYWYSISSLVTGRELSSGNSLFIKLQRLRPRKGKSMSLTINTSQVSTTLCPHDRGSSWIQYVEESITLLLSSNRGWEQTLEQLQNHNPQHKSILLENPPVTWYRWSSSRRSMECHHPPVQENSCKFHS
jgi:hypothetical protein